MREALNRRRKRECSQQSITQRMRTEANSQGLRNISLDDLQCAFATIEEQDDKLITKAKGLPFYKEIREAPLPEGFKLLSIKAYERKANP